MHTSQAVYRDLFDALFAYRGRSVYTVLLAPWARTHSDEVRWIRSFGERRGNPIPPAETEDLWRLYALSRVFDVLLLRFQPRRHSEDDWPGPPLSLDEYQAFATSLGLTSSRPVMFSPFYHEIVHVEPAADPSEAPAGLEYIWPCLMLGDMLFSRAGVRVRSGEQVVAPGVANSSTLYWAYTRRYRPCRDLSHGWGSNSQWRTPFRRDYRLGNVFYYNVDGKVQLSDVNPGSPMEHDLTIGERVELLTHRCFVITRKAHEDLWPYDDKLVVQAKI